MTALWYVCITKPRREHHAVLKLREQGYEVYLPRLTVWTRHKGAWQRREQIMFPRYLFLRCARPGQGLAAIRNTPGVTGLVRFGLEPATIDAVTLDAIRALERQQALDPDTQANPFQVGARVTLADGPLKGLTGIVSRVARERVVVLLALLGGEQPVTVPVDQLVADDGGA